MERVKMILWPEMVLCIYVYGFMGARVVSLLFAPSKGGERGARGSGEGTYVVEGRGESDMALLGPLRSSRNKRGSHANINS